MAVSTHYGSHQAIFRVVLTKCLDKCFCFGCPGFRQVHIVGSALKVMIYPMLLEGLDKMHGPSHEGASPAKLLCQVTTLS